MNVSVAQDGIGWRTRPDPRGLTSALQLMLAVWTLLVAGAALGPRLGRSPAVVLSFGAATWLMLAARPASGTAAMRPGVVVAGALAGFASYPAWAFLIVWVGLGIGLPPRLGAPPGAGSPLLWVATLVLAPVFEELLYRGRLLPALRARIGALPAIAASSLLFALPHLDPWNVLGTFCVGLMLGSVQLTSGSTALCIALHAGLNGACLLLGVPPVRELLAPLTSAALGGALLVGAVLASRRWHPRPGA